MSRLFASSRQNIGTSALASVLEYLVLISFRFLDVLSVQFSHSVVSDSLRSHELQHARSPCPSPTPGVHPNSCPSSR